MTGVEKAIASFLGNPKTTCLGIWGEVGSGKMHSTTEVARRQGWTYQVLDRAQGAIDYRKLGRHMLGESGLTASLYIICNAKESSWESLRAITGKLVFIANEEQNLAPLKRAKFPVEKARRPTVDQMTRALFLEHDWPVEKAKRLSALAEGDWRRVWLLDRLFRDANVDFASVSDGEFLEALGTMGKDDLRDVHPTLKVHQLFSATSAQTPLERYANMETLVWSQANLGVVCDNLEDMLAMAESAVSCDLLMSAADDDGLARSLGLDHFARSARSIGGNRLGYYDRSRFGGPYQKDANVTESIKDSFDRLRPSNWHLKRALEDEGVEEIGHTRSRAKAKTTTRAKRSATKAK